MTAKLLFDHNLPMRLVTWLKDVFYEANHVYLVGLSQASDLEVWHFARDNNYTIVTKDSDFSDLSILLGAPPKVIWLRIGNASVRDCEQVLRGHQHAIFDFLNAPDTHLMEIARS